MPIPGFLVSGWKRLYEKTTKETWYWHQCRPLSCRDCPAEYMALREAESNGYGAMSAYLKGSVGIKAALEDARKAPTTMQAAHMSAIQNKGLAIDPEFRPCLASLWGPDALDPPPLQYSRVEWVRASKLCGPAASLWPDRAIDPEGEIEPGVLGSPWFWIATAACGDQKLRSLIRSASGGRGSGFDTEGVYVVRTPLLSVGVGGLETTVDDLIPCIDGRPAFGSYGAGHTAWSLLLAKAFAKASGSYRSLFALDGSAMQGRLLPGLIGGNGDASPRTMAYQATIAAPIMGLAKCVLHSPLCGGEDGESAEEGRFTSRFIESIAEVAEKSTQLSNKSRQKRAARCTEPHFVLSVKEIGIIGLDVICEGSMPPDLLARLLDSMGRLLATLTVEEMCRGKEKEILVEGSKGPFTLRFDSETGGLNILDLGVDVGCTHLLNVKYTG